MKNVLLQEEVPFEQEYMSKADYYSPRPLQLWRLSSGLMRISLKG